jgi:hypothetical protein
MGGEPRRWKTHNLKELKTRVKVLSSLVLTGNAHDAHLIIHRTFQVFQHLGTTSRGGR